ncbi:MAG: hypothetical protein ACYCRG_04500 [Acidimicrobiales bacterium]
MSDRLDAPPQEYDPASMPAPSFANQRAPWFRRPWVLVSSAVVVVAAISIATDLPRPITVAQDVAAQNAVLSQMRADARECAFAVKESFHLYDRFSAGGLSPSQLATTKTYIAEDEVPCSFAGQPVYDLTNNVQITLTAAGHHVDAAHTALDHWISGTALKAIEDIRQLIDGPASAALQANLAYQAHELNRERLHVLGDIAQAERVLGTTLVTPDLPVVSPPAGG